MQNAVVVTLVGYSEGFNGEEQRETVRKNLRPVRLAQKFIFGILLCLCLGMVSSIFAADTTEDTSSAWKISLEAKMDAASRNFAEMSKLGKLKTDELARRELERAHVYSDERILFVRMRYDPYDGSVAFPWMSHFEFGYGDIFPLETIARTSSNGEAWEEPNTCYVKYCKSF